LMPSRHLLKRSAAARAGEQVAADSPWLPPSLAHCLPAGSRRATIRLVSSLIRYRTSAIPLLEQGHVVGGGGGRRLPGLISIDSKGVIHQRPGN
jgi:hypothetical protein